MRKTLQIRRIGQTLQPKVKGFSVGFFLLLTQITLAQLPVFTLNATSTDETCPGNATITCNVTDTDPAATISYRIFLLPNTTTPIAVLSPTNNVLGSLTAGNYQVVATQTLAPDSNTQTQNITINDQTIPLLYTVGGTGVSCGNNGTMTVNVFSGTAVSYEIISGPIIRPLQSSNLFTGLAAGEYQIRVFDTCGEGWVITHTLFQSAGGALTWADTDQGEMVTCNEMTIVNNLSSALDGTLTYPITVTYTIYPPGGGAPIVQTTTMTSGDISEQEFTTVIPYYSNQVYTYNVTVVDGCGIGYYFDNILINKHLLVEFRSPPAECGEYYIVFASQYYMPPYTITFTDAPAGFNPIDFNPGHPGPYTEPLTSYGSTTNGVPFGHYEAVITDSCGRSVTVGATLDFTPPEPQPDFVPHDGCNSNISDVTIKITGYIIAAGIIVSGPSTYSTAYPVDVTTNIDPMLGSLEIPNMNVGTYMVVMTDTCGNNYNYELVVTDPGTPMGWLHLTGCEPGNGSVRINATTGVTFQSVKIIAAPATYAQPLPQDVSYNISPDTPGIFSMASLPGGSYTFEIVDSCGFIREMTMPILGYVPITDDTYTVIEHCGSFDLDVHFLPTGPASVVTSTLWLQRYDPVTNTWGHPQTGAVYNPGDTPDYTNSYRLLVHNGINYNIAYLGDFRILHRFQSFGNGGVQLYNLCVEELTTFKVLNEIEITDIQKTTCNGVNSNVTITAIGVPPMTYQITTMNGQPHFVDNGTNNMFTNLLPAVYNFQVLDSCGNITNELTDVAELPSLVIINQPPDLIECDGTENDAKAVFDLSSQNAAVLGSANPANFIISYHLSQGEANTASNPLPGIYTSGSQEIFCRLQFKDVATCYETTSFHLIVNQYPTLDMELTQAICEGENITITADAGFDSYLWSTGATTPSIVVNEPGTYTVEVTLTANGVTCTATYSVIVTVNQLPKIHHIETEDWTFSENTIGVYLESDTLSGDYTYSIDGVNWYTGHIFWGLQPGEYTVYIKSACGIVTEKVYLLGYPRYFTPNGDGYHDYWNVFFADREPGIKIYIFDRYGKLLTGFGAESPGWDGKYNGHDMPSTDYWFLVKRIDGREHRGHFAMKR